MNPRRAAAVDIGSTSVHLLVAEVSDGGLEPIVDLSEISAWAPGSRRTDTLDRLPGLS